MNCAGTRWYRRVTFSNNIDKRCCDVCVCVLTLTPDKSRSTYKFPSFNLRSLCSLGVCLHFCAWLHRCMSFEWSAQLLRQSKANISANNNSRMSVEMKWLRKKSRDFFFVCLFSLASSSSFLWGMTGWFRFLFYFFATSTRLNGGTFPAKCLFIYHFFFEATTFTRKVAYIQVSPLSKYFSFESNTYIVEWVGRGRDRKRK